MKIAGRVLQALLWVTAVGLGACGSKRPHGEQVAIVEGCEARFGAAVQAARRESPEAEARLAEAAALLDPLCVSGLHEALRTTDPTTRRTAAEVMRRTPQHDHIALLVTNLSAGSPEDQRSIAEALGTLTRQDHGTDPSAWRRWLDAQPR